MRRTPRTPAERGQLKDVVEVAPGQWLSGRDALEKAIDDAIKYGEPFDRSDFYVPYQSTKFVTAKIEREDT